MLRFIKGLNWDIFNLGFTLKVIEVLQRGKYFKLTEVRKSFFHDSRVE